MDSLSKFSLTALRVANVVAAGRRDIAIQFYETRSQPPDELRYNDNGSVDLYFGPEAPDGFENNWVETIPERVTAD